MKIFQRANNNIFQFSSTENLFTYKKNNKFEINSERLQVKDIQKVSFVPHLTDFSTQPL